MNKRPIVINVSGLKSIDLRIGEENSVAVFRGREIYPQRTRNRKRLVPRFDFGRSVLVVVRGLLHEGRGPVPGPGIFLLHGWNKLLSGCDFRSERRWGR